MILGAICVWGVLCSCSDKVERQMEKALEMVGTNRAELEKVMGHYRGDSLKLRAVRFLIENMQYHFSVNERFVSKKGESYYPDITRFGGAASVKDFYLNELVGIEAISQPVTMIQADSAEYHYGVVGENMTASRNIILKNTGKEVFRIKGITTSCDCMTAGYDWDEIPPGGKAAMTVEYKAEEPGDFWRTITIYGNIPSKSVTLDFWGTVKKREINKRGNMNYGLAN